MLRKVLLPRCALSVIALAVAGSSAAVAAPFAYVADRVGGVVSVIDRATHTVVKTIEVGPAPVATAVHPDGSTVYVTIGPLREVAVIDAAKSTVVRRIEVGDNPTGIDISPDGRMLYVVNTGDRTVSIIDTASQTGRSHERHRRVAWTALTSAMAQAMSLVTLLITAPLSLDYLGVERYGLLITITSFAALLNFADLGIGNGLINAVSCRRSGSFRSAGSRSAWRSIRMERPSTSQTCSTKDSFRWSTPSPTR